jgi:hypothetical protein
VVRLSDGSLWVHSPVALDGELRAGLDALGPVKHIVVRRELPRLGRGTPACMPLLC